MMSVLGGLAENGTRSQSFETLPVLPAAVSTKSEAASTPWIRMSRQHAPLFANSRRRSGGARDLVNLEAS